MGVKKLVVTAPGQTPSPDDFVLYTATPDIRFLKQGVQPPSQVYVDVGDDIVVGCASSLAGERVTISYRLLRADGQLVLGQFTVAPAADRSIKVYSESLAEGFLLSVSCKAAAATTRGQTFVRVFLTDPSLGAGQPSYMLMADYVTTAMAPAHPNGRVLAPVEGPGQPRNIAVANPAPGADWQQAVPLNARWKVRSLTATLATSAAVANRLPGLALFTAGNPIYNSYADKVQPASQLCQYGASAITQYLSPSPLVGSMCLPPESVQRAGDLIESGTLNLQAGDQWQGIFIAVEEWLDNV